MADGSTLGFGLTHVDPIKNNPQHVFSVLNLMGYDYVCYHENEPGCYRTKMVSKRGKKGLSRDDEA